MGEDIRKGCRRVNMVEILHNHILYNYIWKKCDLLKLFQECGERKKKNDRGGKFNYDIL
jgi:hypothetical protein